MWLGFEPESLCFITQLYASAHSDWLIFYEKEMDDLYR